MRQFKKAVSDRNRPVIEARYHTGPKTAIESACAFAGISADDDAALFRLIWLVVDVPTWMRSMVLDPT